jgi:hypothetical protein
MNRRVVGLLSDIISAGERILQFVGNSSSYSAVNTAYMLQFYGGVC